MIHRLARNAHGAISDLCCTLHGSFDDILEAEYPRVSVPVGISLRAPRERMVFDQELNPINWFAMLAEVLPEFGTLIEPATMFAPSKFATNIHPLSWEDMLIYFRNDRYGHLDMQVHVGPLYIINLPERLFILTMLQEYTALMLELPMGGFGITVAQLSLPVDMEFVNRFVNRWALAPNENPYHISSCVPSEMTLANNMLAEAANYPAMGIKNRWIRRTLSPMWQAHEALHGEERDERGAMQRSQNCESLDVARATRMYLEGLHGE